MTNNYMIHAWCLRPFIAYLDPVEVDSPEQAIAIARQQPEKLIDAAEECNSGYPWNEFTVYDEDGKELLHVMDTDAHAREAATAQAILLDMLRYGVLTLSDGDAEFEAVIYTFDDSDPDWRALLDAIGEQRARAAIDNAKAPAASIDHN